jgi:hypothetical protein
MHFPVPCGVEQVFLVQHLMSDEPGQRPAVVVPEQHPAETLTQTPSIPPAVHVALYEQFEVESSRNSADTKAAKAATKYDFIYINY